MLVPDGRKLVGKARIPGSHDSQAGYTLLAEEPVIVNDVANEKRFQAPEFLTEHQVISGMSCVINHSVPPYGVIGVHSKKARVFTQDDANFLLSGPGKNSRSS